MKRQIILLWLTVEVILTSPIWAWENKTFTEDGTISPGEEWNEVYIYGDETDVDMFGGMVDFIKTYDESTLNIFNGSTETSAHDYSTVNVYGGSHSGVLSRNESTSNFYSGAISRNIRAADNGVSNMYGGVVESIGCGGNGIVNLYNGTILVSIGASDISTINIYGYNLDKTATGGNLGYGLVSGYWVDDTAFNVSLSGSDTFNRIVLHEIPEPMSLGLFLLGTLVYARKRA